MSQVPAAALAEAWTETYLWTHESWSPADPGVLRDRAGALIADLDPAASVRATRAGRPCATAWVFTGIPGPVTVVAETVRPDEPAGIGLVAATLAA
jgi:hypothetical protein